MTPITNCSTALNTQGHAVINLTSSSSLCGRVCRSTKRRKRRRLLGSSHARHVRAHLRRASVITGEHGSHIRSMTWYCNSTGTTAWVVMAEGMQVSRDCPRELARAQGSDLICSYERVHKPNLVPIPSCRSCLTSSYSSRANLEVVFNDILVNPVPPSLYISEGFARP